MNKHKRIYIVGHPGAGKALFAKTLAEKLGWQFIDADLGLEFRIGRTLSEILGKEGENAFHERESEILASQQNQENMVVTTDAGIVCSDKNQALLSTEFVVYLKVSTSVQLGRTPRNPDPLLETDIKTFLDKLHHERDALYDQVSDFTIDTDDSALEKHVMSVVNIILGSENKKQPVEEVKSDKDFAFFHKNTHTPVRLSDKQAQCLKLLAQGKTSKEIADEMNISYRTVEDYTAKIMEILGCASSKELIALYYDQP